jgi:hypothetical protein
MRFQTENSPTLPPRTSVTQRLCASNHNTQQRTNCKPHRRMLLKNYAIKQLEQTPIPILNPPALPPLPTLLHIAHPHAWKHYDARLAPLIAPLASVSGELPADGVPSWQRHASTDNPLQHTCVAAAYEKYSALSIRFAPRKVAPRELHARTCARLCGRQRLPPLFEGPFPVPPTLHSQLFLRLRERVSAELRPALTHLHTYAHTTASKNKSCELVHATSSAALQHVPLA